MGKKKKALLILVLLVLFFFLYQLRLILMPFVLAIIVTYLINPIIKRLISQGMPRTGAIIFVFGISLAVIIFLLTIIIPLLIEEVELLTAKLPLYIEELNEFIREFNQRYENIQLPAIINDAIIMLTNRIEEGFISIISLLGESFLLLISRGFIFLITPVLIFYFLKDIEQIKIRFWKFIPDKYHQDLKELLENIDQVMIGFLRGQLIVCSFVGVSVVLGLYLLDVKFPLILGAIAGALNIIPYFGPFLGTIPAVIVAAFYSFSLALSVLALFIVIQQIESSIVSPEVLGEEVGLHPVFIIFSILAGGELYGWIGLIIAIPLAAVSKEVIKFLLDKELLKVDNE